MDIDPPHMADSHQRLSYLEGTVDWVNSALELSVILNDLYLRYDQNLSEQHVFSEVIKGLRNLFQFSRLGLLLVDEESYDFSLKAFMPETDNDKLQHEIEYQIDSGNFAWALDQTKACLVRSRDGSSTTVLYTLATYTRVRGMFIAVYDGQVSDIKDIQLNFLSIMLQGIANTIENKQIYNFVNDQKRNLEQIVESRTYELVNARVEAERANEAKSRFLANMSHEIRTPLTSVIGYAEWLQNEDISAAERGEATASILRTGRHLLEIINEILDLSKIESDRIEIEEMMIMLGGLLKEVGRVVKMNARSKGIDFRINYEFPLPRWIITDPTRLKQILINLCSNAIKFTDKGSVTINVSSDCQTNKIEFTVTDTGIGIPADKIDTLFDSFTQADSSTTRKYGGSGLGLNISRSLARMMGGDIVVTSTINEGSSFTVYLPVGKAAIRDMAENLDELSVTGFDIGQQDEQNAMPSLSGTVLLAEDNPDNQRLVQFHLQRVGATLDIAGNGREAVERALENSYDLILMDMQMPEMDGVEAAELLRQAGYDIPIVALTANISREDRERCERAGFDDFLTKPFDKVRLNHVLKQYLKPATSDGREPVESSASVNEEMKKLTEQFVSDLPSRMGRISKALADQQWDELRTLMHQLKGASGGYGFAQLGKIAGRIEAIIIDHSFHDVPLLLHEFEDELASITGTGGNGGGQKTERGL